MRLPATDNYMCLYNIYSDSTPSTSDSANCIISFFYKRNVYNWSSSHPSSRLQLKMKWLSVLALCAALFIAATHASQLQDEEEMLDHAAKEKLLQSLLDNQAAAEFENEIKLADEETVVYKGRISAARDKAKAKAARCECHCSGGGWKL